jgi:hypothetical protein
MGAMNDVSFLPREHLVAAPMNNPRDGEIDGPGWIRVTGVPE